MVATQSIGGAAVIVRVTRTRFPLLQYLLDQGDGHGSDGVLQCVDLMNGSVSWSTKIRNEFLSLSGKTSLSLMTESLLVGGRGVLKVEKKSGSVEWSQSHVGKTGEDLRFANAPNEILLYGSTQTSVIDRETGNVRWISESENGFVQIATVLEGHVFRVVADRDGGPGFSLDALHLDTGEVVWSATEEVHMASPLVAEEKCLVYTTDGDFVGRGAENGEEYFRTQLPEDFKAMSPNRPKWVRQPFEKSMPPWTTDRLLTGATP